MPHPLSAGARARVGLAGAILVLVGGLVVATVPDSAWVAEIALRHSTPGRACGLVVVVCGLGLLTAAWISLWRGARLGTVDMATVHRCCALWCLPLLLAPPMFSRDGWSYAAQGELTRLGLSPYVWGPGVLDGPILEAVDPLWRQTPAPYGPLPLVWGAAAASLLPGSWSLVVAHRVLALVGLALLAWGVPRLAAWTGQNPVERSALVLACPLVMAHGVAGLHNDLLVAGLVVAALVAGVERGWATGAFVAGLAAAVKLPGGLVGVAVVLASLPVAAPLGQRIVRALQVAAVAAATLVGIGAASGLGVGWVHALGVPGSVTAPLSLTARLDEVVPGAQAGGELLALGLVGWVAARARPGSRVAALHAAALCLTLTVLLGPAVRPWYALWCVPLLAVSRLGERGVAVLVWCVATLGITAPLDSSLVGSPGLIALAAGLVVAIALALAWTLRPTDDRASSWRPGPSRRLVPDR